MCNVQNKLNISYFDAIKILDMLKDGKNYPLHVINYALMLTGDLEENDE